MEIQQVLLKVQMAWVFNLYMQLFSSCRLDGSHLHIMIWFSTGFMFSYWEQIILYLWEYNSHGCNRIIVLFFTSLIQKILQPTVFWPIGTLSETTTTANYVHGGIFLTLSNPGSQEKAISQDARQKKYCFLNLLYLHLWVERKTSPVECLQRGETGRLI